MNAIIYARVSTEEQAREGYSLASQREACQAKALEIGARDPLEYIDEGVSGEVLERPGLAKARAAIRMGGVNSFICYDPDRLARKAAHQMIVTEEIERAGVRLEFVNFDRTNTPEGNMFYQMRGVIAEYEKEKIKERTTRGKVQKARQGGLTHWPGTYGYSYTKRNGKKDGFVTVNEEEAEVVRQIYLWFISEDVGYHQIASRLAEEGIPSPRGAEWARITVKRILTNPAYQGDYMVHRYDAAGVGNNRFRPVQDRVRPRLRPEEDWIRLSIPPIIGGKIWAAAQEKAAEARRIRSGCPKATYLLSGIARCQVCGATVHGNLVTNRAKRKIPYYVCTHKTPGVAGIPKCILPYLQSGPIDAQVWGLIKDWLTNTGVLARHLAAQSPADDAKREIARLGKTFEQGGKERSRLLTALQKGLAPEEEIVARLLEIKRREEQVKAILEELESQSRAVPPVKDAITSVKEVAEKLGPELEALPFEKRREVARLLIKQVIVGPEEIIIRAKVPEFLTRTVSRGEISAG